MEHGYWTIYFSAGFQEGKEAGPLDPKPRESL